MKILKLITVLLFISIVSFSQTNERILNINVLFNTNSLHFLDIDLDGTNDFYLSFYSDTSSPAPTTDCTTNDSVKVSCDKITALSFTGVCDSCVLNTMNYNMPTDVSINNTNILIDEQLRYTKTSLLYYGCKGVLNCYGIGFGLFNQSFKTDKYFGYFTYEILNNGNILLNKVYYDNQPLIPLNDTCYYSVADTLIINISVNNVNSPVKVWFTAYPIPAHNTLYLNSNGLLVGYEVQLVNNLGQVVVKKRVSNTWLAIDVYNYSVGLYQLRILNVNGQIIETKNIIIQ
jgi:hypothetical protein